jgi:hypothetical protein
MFGHPNLFLIYEFSKISFSIKNCLHFFTVSQSKEVGFIFRKKNLVDLFLQEEGPETLGDLNTP